MAEIFDLAVTDADNTGRFPEGQAPSTVNNGARALEGILARGFRDTIIPDRTTTGSANAQALTPNATVATLTAGMMFTWKAGYTNTAAMTLNVADTAATGAKSVKTTNGSDPWAGAVTAGGYYTTIYDGTNHVLLNPSGIGDGAVTLAKMADLAAKKFIARFTASTGVPEAGDVADEFALDATAKKLYFKGGIQGGYKNLKIVSADAGTSSVVTIDAITVEDTNGYSKRLQTVSETIDLSTSGANGLDTGSVATSTWYYLWIIAKEDGTVDGLGSASATAPTMPTGYTYKALIGAVRTKSGSAVILGSIQYGRTVRYTLPRELTTGAQGTAGSAWATVAIGDFAPTAVASRIYVNFIGSAANQYAAIAPNSGYTAHITGSSNPAPFMAGYIPNALNATVAGAEGSFLLESTNVYVMCTSNGKTFVGGFDINL